MLNIRPLIAIYVKFTLWTENTIFCSKLQILFKPKLNPAKPFVTKGGYHFIYWYFTKRQGSNYLNNFIILFLWHGPYTWFMLLNSINKHVGIEENFYPYLTLGFNDNCHIYGPKLLKIAHVLCNIFRNTLMYVISRHEFYFPQKIDFCCHMAIVASY